MTGEELGEILDNLDMEDYLSWVGVDYKRTHGHSGAQLNLKECPRCHGSSWKVYLNAETGLGNCFHGSCAGEPGFNKFTFIKHLGGFTGAETVKHIEQYARESGWRPKRIVPVATDNGDIELPKSIELPKDGKNAKYLIDRGITPEITQYFGLRLCIKGWYKYTKDSTDTFQAYHNRIIIPIYDLDGTLVNFQGRDITGTSDRRYQFPPGLAGTGHFLYNGQNAWGAQRIVLNEGAFDVMATKMALDEDVELRSIVPVGTFGKHLSDGDDGQVARLMKLKRAGLSRITFMWDCDALSEAAKTAVALSALGFMCDIAVLPGKDPNELPASEVRRALLMAEKVRNSFDVVKLLGKHKGKL
jgi:DNA primase